VVSSWLRRVGKPRRARASTRGEARLLRLLLCHLLPLWVLLAFARGASAADMPEPVSGAGASPLAPICDAMGASAGVPAEVPEVDRGRLEELPCEALISFVGWHLGTHEAGPGLATWRDHDPSQPVQLQLDRSRPDAAVAWTLAFPERGVPLWIPPSLEDGIGSSPGHRLAIYRPPVRSL
jgi:hypothetical protein